MTQQENTGRQEILSGRTEEIPEPKGTLWARIVSILCSPYLVPLLTFVFIYRILFLKLTPLRFQLIILSVVANFTLLVPLFSLIVFRKLSKLKAEDMGTRPMRFFSLIIFAISYVFCILLLKRMGAAWLLSGAVLSILLSLVACILLNRFMRPSEHLAGAGVLTGMATAFGAFFGFSPLLPICIILIITGILGTARIVLDRSGLWAELLSYLIGLILSMLVLDPRLGMPFSWILF